VSTKSGEVQRGCVYYIQDSVFSLQRIAGQALADAHDVLSGFSRTQGATAAILDTARAQLRQVQWSWDFVASSNSTGFYDPVQAQRSLALSIDPARRAESTARAVTVPKY
jgi:nitrite reductase (cytochrome c-552)